MSILCDTMLVDKEKPRLDEVDLLRGFFVASLVVIHLRLWPNLLMAISGGSKLWVSVDSGFFALSGFLLGFLNRNLWFTDRQKACNKLLSRAAKLYFWSIFTTLVFTWWGNHLTVEYQKTGMWEVNHNFLEMLYKTVTFQYVYGWADYLNYYTIYIFLTPLFLYFASNLSVFFAVFVSFFIYSFHALNPYFGLQIFFFLSMLVGFNYDFFVALYQKISTRTLLQSILNLLFWSSLALSIFSVHYFTFLANKFLSVGMASSLIHKNNVLNLYFDKQSVAIGRVLLWPIWMYGFLRVFSKFKSELSSFLGGFLLKLGQNSLKVYLIHAFVIFPAPYFLKLLSVDSYLERTIFSAVILGIVYVITIKTKFKV